MVLGSYGFRYNFRGWLRITKNHEAAVLHFDLLTRLCLYCLYEISKRSYRVILFAVSCALGLRFS